MMCVTLEVINTCQLHKIAKLVIIHDYQLATNT
jgi:hypothetical protein